MRTDASERKGAANPPAIASERARAELTRVFMSRIIPYLPRCVQGFAADFCRALLCQSERNFRFCLVGQRERLKG